MQHSGENRRRELLGCSCRLSRHHRRHRHRHRRHRRRRHRRGRGRGRGRIRVVRRSPTNSIVIISLARGSRTELGSDALVVHSLTLLAQNREVYPTKAQTKSAKGHNGFGSLCGSQLGAIEWNEPHLVDSAAYENALQRIENDAIDLVYRTHNPLVEGSIPSGPT